MKKNKISELKIFTNKKEYPAIRPLAAKDKDDLVVVPDDVYKKMTSGTGVGGSNANVSTTSSSSTVYEEDGIGKPVEVPNQDVPPVEPVQVDAVIEPQDPETIKYLSNVRDDKTGEISKPFVIADKRYQMVRGLKPNREIVLAVICLDEMGADGKHMIHTSEDFERKIAGPMLEAEKTTQGGDPYSQGVDYSDLEDHKHFFVNKTDGSVKAKFRTIKDMMRSGIPLGEDEKYSNLRELKKERINRAMSTPINETDNVNEVDMGKLKTDVEKLVNLIKTRFSAAFAKLDKPIEQVQFLDALGQEFGLTKDRIAKLTTSLKTGNVDTDVNAEKPEADNLGATYAQAAESKIITKQQFSESIKKDLKNNGRI